MINRFKKTQKEKPKKDKKVARPIMAVLSGSILTREEVMKHLPFLLFAAFLALVYIANGYLAEHTVRSINSMSNELKELRSEYITTKSDLMYKSKQSELAKTIAGKGMGLKESYTPPKKIVIETEGTDNEFLMAEMQ